MTPKGHQKDTNMTKGNPVGYDDLDVAVDDYSWVAFVC
jgi:hypothetical protein